MTAPPYVDLGIFVHRVTGLAPGLYALQRGAEDLRHALTAPFAWTRPEGCPEGLPLFLLEESGQSARLATHVSCNQEIAGAGVFSLGMFAHLAPITRFGPWFYRRLFWETGIIGQVLYLEAEAAGLRATGIGCFFDDAMHEAFGVDRAIMQSLYHFTVGGAVPDDRLGSEPAYPEALRRSRTAK